MSDWKIQIEIEINIPKKERKKKKYILYLIFSNIRKRPNPPIFNSKDARIIDPIVGASTCAFGNQKWTKIIGSFTKKGNSKKKKKNLEHIFSIYKNILLEWKKVKICVKIIKRGKEKIEAYKRR